MIDFFRKQAIVINYYGIVHGKIKTIGKGYGWLFRSIVFNICFLIV